MNILANVFNPQFRSIDSDVIKRINTGLYGLPLLFGSSTTKANETTALTLSAFYNAIDILSDDIAKLPKAVYKKEDDKRLNYSEHPVNNLLSVRPNPKMTPFVFWKTIETLRLIKGNAYAKIERDANSGRQIAWTLLDNSKMEVLETPNDLVYKYEGKAIASSDILHFLGFSLNGKVGVGVVTYAANQLGVSLEAQAYGNTIYKNRGLTYGVIEADGPVTDPNKKLISEGFTAKLSEQNPHKAPVLDEGLKYKSISITPEEAQFLETNKNGIIEVCRWLNIAPHKLKELNNANYSNIYQQSIEHVQDSVLPRVTSKEQEINYKCFSSKEQGVCYIKFNLSVLLRGDLDAKSKYYTSMVYASIMSPNEVRALEDMNPMDGLDEVMRPVNMQALSLANELLQNQVNGNSK